MSNKIKLSEKVNDYVAEAICLHEAITRAQFNEMVDSPDKDGLSYESVKLLRESGALS